MTPKKADQLIKAGKPATFHHPFYNETFTGTPVSRDRWNIKININGQVGLFDRGDLQVVTT